MHHRNLKLSLTFPRAIATDSDGNIFVADLWNYRIRKISTDGTVTTIAGTGKCGWVDGIAEEAQFGMCFGLAVGSDGSVFVTDFSNHTVRKIQDGLVSTLAGKGRVPGFQDGKGELARFYFPFGICVDSDGSLLVVDSGSYCVRRVSKSGGCFNDCGKWETWKRKRI
jgi:DNA-binding beta-propeller fold protein YncE